LQDIQQDLVADSLKKADGFVGTAEQDHYDECEEAVMGVLSHVRRVARQWKVSNLVLFLPVVYNGVNAGYSEQIQVLRRTWIAREFLPYECYGRHTCASRHN
jgi:hypothetical protein